MTAAVVERVESFTNKTVRVNYHCESSDSNSIRHDAFKRLDKNPLLKAKDLATLMDLDYQQYGKYLNNIKSRWKYHYQNGLGSKCPKQHRVKALVFVPKSLDRKRFVDVGRQAVFAGWEESRNRNKVLLWKKDRFLGRVEWWQTGRVLVYVRKPQTMGRVKQLLCRAFFETNLILDGKILDAFMCNVHWHSSDDVFETGERLPYKVIDNYVESHGLRIVLGDRSHPDSVEVQWCYPDWLERTEQLLEVIAQGFQQMGNCNNHKALEDDYSV